MGWGDGRDGVWNTGGNGGGGGGESDGGGGGGGSDSADGDLRFAPEGRDFVRATCMIQSQGRLWKRNIATLFNNDQ